MTKVNVATPYLNRVFTASLRATLEANPELVDTRRYVGPARDAVAEEVAHLLRTLRLDHAGARPTTY
jgi:fructose-bisphosphate aldolase class II